MQLSDKNTLKLSQYEEIEILPSEYIIKERERKIYPHIVILKKRWRNPHIKGNRCNTSEVQAGIKCKPYDFKLYNFNNYVKEPTLHRTNTCILLSSSYKYTPNKQTNSKRQKQNKNILKD